MADARSLLPYIYQYAGKGGFDHLTRYFSLGLKRAGLRGCCFFSHSSAPKGGIMPIANYTCIKTLRQRKYVIFLSFDTECDFLHIKT